MRKILIVEDEKDILKRLSMFLSEHNFNIIVASSIDEVYEKTDASIDLALLDINLPDGKGDELIKYFKERDIRIIITTVKNDSNYIAKALDNGVDDYITKPFDLNVLRARVDATLRTVNVSDENIIFKDLKMNMNEGKIYYKNSPVNFTALEHGVISLFIKNPNRIFTREHLLQIFWEDNEQFVNDNTLTTTIKRIRDKTSKDLITTIRGIGYRME
nr:response regulator transcription factor [Ezakiella coagulans]